MIHIGPRLAAIAQMVPYGSAVADIGSDHAYLPVYLVQNGIASAVVAGEIKDGHLTAARATVYKVSLLDKISVRKGDGFAVLLPGEVEVAVIAGMGGDTIISILEASPEITSGLKRLILQPMVGARVVRGWLIEHGWFIAAEQLVKEDGHLYEIIVAERGQSRPLDALTLELGPILVDKRHPLLVEHVEVLLGKYRRAAAQMSLSTRTETDERYREITEKIKSLEEIAAWLSAAQRS